MDEKIKAELMSKPSTEDEDLEADSQSLEYYRDILCVIEAKYERLFVELDSQLKSISVASEITLFKYI